MNMAKTYAIIFGIVYSLVGLLGFTVSTTLASAPLIVFPVNVIHNIAHLALIGLPGIWAYFNGKAEMYAKAMTVLFAVLVIGGFFPQPFLGILPLGGADIGLHAASGLLAALAAWGYGARQQTTAAA